MSFGWNEDVDPAVKQQVDDNLFQLVVPDVVASAGRRDPFSLDLGKEWHRRLLTNVTDAQGRCPPLSAGRFRDTTWLPANTFAEIGGHLAVPHALVGREMASLESTFVPRVVSMDGLVPAGTAPAGSRLMHQVVELAAELHGEWVRIHPFVNANGRISRLWCNWVLIRYGLPAFMSPRPRPEWGRSLQSPATTRYGQAAALSMGGDHRQMTAELKRHYKKRTAGN